MILRCIKITLAIVLSLMFTISLAKLVICLWEKIDYLNNGRGDVDQWLEQNQLQGYKELFKRNGKFIIKIVALYRIAFFFQRLIVQKVKTKIMAK